MGITVPIFRQEDIHIVALICLHDSVTNQRESQTLAYSYLHTAGQSRSEVGVNVMLMLSES